jgi:hypothetical protein
MNTVNKKCATCAESCKQPAGSYMVNCKSYKPVELSNEHAPKTHEKGS